MAHPTWPYVFDPAHALYGNLLHHFVGGHGNNHFNDIENGYVLTDPAATTITWTDDAEYGRVAEVTSNGSFILWQNTVTPLWTPSLRPFTVMWWVWVETIADCELFFSSRIGDNTHSMRLRVELDGEVFAGETAGGTAATALGGTISAATWALHTAQFSTATSRFCALNDGAFVQNTTSRSPVGINQTRINVVSTSSVHFKIGPALVFDKLLSEAEKDPFYDSGTRWDHLLETGSGPSAFYLNRIHRQSEET